MRRKPIDNRVQLPRSSFFNQLQFESTSSGLGGATERTKLTKYVKNQKSKQIFVNKEGSEEESEDTSEKIKKAEKVYKKLLPKPNHTSQASTNEFIGSIQNLRNQDLPIFTGIESDNI